MRQVDRSRVSPPVQGCAIRGKVVQVHEIVYADAGGLTVDLPPKTNHAFGYDYYGEGPHRAKRIGDTNLVYDRNGNTLRQCRDQGDPSCLLTSDHLRRFVWTEENRLDQVIDGGGRSITRFVYDAGGDRVVKLGRGGESITLGQFWSLKGRRAATKHVFAGATRLASKLLPPPGWDDVPRGGTVLAGGTGSTQVGDGIPNDTGCDPSDYQPQKCPILPGGDPSITYLHDATKVRAETYYYHSDHLGSTSWVTDHRALVHEHVEYFPYGEVWRDSRHDADAHAVKGQRFLFTGKELDEETGLYYFGARYLDPMRARWTTRDNRLDRTFDPRSLNVYAYVGWNPLAYSDPTGEFKTWVWGQQVHENITKAAARRMDRPYTKELERGVRWPDLPEGVSRFPVNFNSPGTLTYRSHHGDLQHWHGMANGEKTNQEVADEIIGQLREWWTQGVGSRSDFELGRIGHVVHDAFTGSHIARDENGGILFFQNYNAQDAGLHAGADKGAFWPDVPGAIRAYEATKQLMKLYDRKVDFAEAEKYLRQHVYRFAPGAAAAPPGGSAPQYQRRESTSSSLP